MNIEEIKQSLTHITAPQDDSDIVAKGYVSEVEIEEGEVIVTLRLDDFDRDGRHALESAVLEAVSKLDGVEDVSIEIETSQVPAAPTQEPGLSNYSPAAPKQAEVKPAKTALSQVKNLIGVASGKGGVGKSTVACNLAMALKARGATVGICDIDIYGPSVPIQMGVPQAKPGVSDDQKRFKPVDAYGIKVMSIGFLVDDDTPVIWRGPIVSSVVKQFLEDVDWGELDYLVIDMPPGTGDAQLTLSQSAPLTGALIVTTPSQLALVDAQKGLQMFRKVDIPVLGLVENMSYYVCGECGNESTPFNAGRTDAVCKETGVEVISRIPLDHEIQRGSDDGRPVVATAPDSPQAKSFLDLADHVMEKCPADEKKGFLSGLFGR